MYWAQRALPLRAMTRWNNPSANGDMANIVADAAPESSPNKVTDSGSPPKESMLSLIQRSAVSWSWRAQLPGNRLSPVLRKPLIKLNEPNHRLNSRNRRSWRNLYLWQPGTQFNLISQRLAVYSGTSSRWVGVFRRWIQFRRYWRRCSGNSQYGTPVLSEPLRALAIDINRKARDCSLPNKAYGF